jgi:GT2 family glycosyltransferase
MVELSVVILVHNQWEMTRRCLSSLLASNVTSEWEILAVDNASTESMGGLLEECKGSERIRWLRNEENLPFSIANNLAAAQAKGRWVLFLNNDVEVSEGCVDLLLKRLKESSSSGIAGCRLLFPDSNRIQHAGIVPMLWGYPSNYGVGADSNDPRFRVTSSVFAVTGAMLCIDARLFRQIGGFDERYRWGYEDVDLCLKCTEHGRDVLYVGETASHHAESSTLNGSRVRTDLERNYALYRLKWNLILVPREEAFLQSLGRKSKRIAIFGTGLAARGLYSLLAESDIEVTAFTSRKPEQSSYLGRPVVPLSEVKGLGCDVVLVGSQFYFELEDEIRAATGHELLLPTV